MSAIPTQTPANILNAVDYFKAKLQFEQTPNGLKEIMDLSSILIIDVRDRESFEKEELVGGIEEWKKKGFPIEGREVKEVKNTGGVKDIPKPQD